MKKTALAGLTAFLLIAGVFAQSTEVRDLKTRIIDLQNQGELGFQDFTLCSQILGYASFVPVREPVIDKNGTLLIYYEPQNIFTVVREGIYEIWYTQDMAVLHDKLRNASVTKMFDFEVRTP